MNTKCDEIKQLVLDTIPDVGNFASEIEGLRLARRDAPTEFLRCFYEPSCTLVLQGKKRLVFGEETLSYGRGQILVSAADIPVTSRVIEAEQNAPFVVMILRLDASLISDLLLEFDEVSELGKEITSENDCDNPIAVCDAEDDLLDAFFRLASLLKSPKSERQVLSKMVIREIHFRLLQGKLGSQLRQVNTKGTRSNQITRSIAFLKERYREKLSVEQIAQSVNMAPSSFYRNFKRLTSVSPLQYQKQLRLNEAQRLMLTGRHNAMTACYEVGYESPSQFTREYKKMFGMPPKTDVARLKVIDG